jgi:hypothetical protein
VSELNGAEAVSLNGSGLWVTDSKATALVDVELLMRTGGIVAANPDRQTPGAKISKRGRKIRTKVFFTHDDRLILMVLQLHY